jgi:hypothetical protein
MILKLLPVCAVLAFAALPALAQPVPASGAKFDRPDFTGTWERYPVAGDKRLDTTVSAPPPMRPSRR